MDMMFNTEMIVKDMKGGKEDMTEKLFNVFDVDGTVFLEDHIEGSYHIGEKENVDIHCLNDIADRLNTYADENEQLKSELSEKDIQLDFLKDENKHMRDLVNENGQLKQREKTLEGMIRTFDEGCKEIYDDKCRLEEENEQLKQTNQRLNDELQETMGYLALKSGVEKENEQLKSDLGYYRETYSIQEYGLDIETHVQLSSPILSRKELLKENEQLYELINFANTLIAFKTSESCQKEWEKRLKELKE